MLKPSSQFTADEIRYLQTGAAEWINNTNESIIKAAANGLEEVTISIWDNSNKTYTCFTRAPSAIIAHFENRGFKMERNGQSSIIISWRKE